VWQSDYIQNGHFCSKGPRIALQLSKTGWRTLLSSPAFLPDGKCDLVNSFQKSGAQIGMCGDGASDAPALRQAQTDIAVDSGQSAAAVVSNAVGL
jgi:phosphoserine phosphatase